MRRRDVRVAAIALIVVATAACGSSAPSAVPNPSPSSHATSFDEYAVAFCSAFDALFLAVGNPDTASGSALSKALDAAVAAGDAALADQLATEITHELESGRQHVAFARGWPPAAPMMAHLDRVFVAFEAMIAAKRAAAAHAPDPIDPQAAFEQAGGLAAWFAMFEAGRAMASERPARAQQCPNLPIGP